jgi:hypothetical protein
MKKIIVAAFLIANCGGVLGADPDPKAACTTGDPWILPPSKTNNLGEETIVLNAPQGIRVKLCNCTQNQPIDAYIDVNAYLQKPAPGNDLPSPNSPSRLYVGSCLEAGGTDIKIRNPSTSSSANGTYTVR